MSFPSRILLHTRKTVAIPVEFNSNVSTNIQKNGIYLMVATDMATAVAACFDFTCSTRLGFIDV